MNRFWMRSCTLIACLCITLPSEVGGQDWPESEPRTILARGSADLSAGYPVARERAVEQALRQAVERAVGVLVHSETIVQNSVLLSDEILSRARGFVHSYSVLEEWDDGEEILSVLVEAEVSGEVLASNLEILGLLSLRMGLPRIRVHAEDLSGSERRVGHEVLSQELVTLLREAGIILVSEPGTEEVLVTAQVIVDDQEGVQGLHSAMAVVSIHARTGSGEELAAEGGSAVGAGASQAMARRNAAERAVRTQVKAFVERLALVWGAALNEPSRVAIRLEGIRSYSDVLLFEDQLRLAIPGTERLLERRISLGERTAELDWIGFGRTDEVGSAIQGYRFEPFMIVVESSSPGRLTLRLKER